MQAVSDEIAVTAYATQNTGVNDNIWHHFVFIIDIVNSEAQIFLDGNDLPINYNNQGQPDMVNLPYPLFIGAINFAKEIRTFAAVIFDFLPIG